MIQVNRIVLIAGLITMVLAKRDCRVDYSVWSRCEGQCGSGLQHRRGIVVQRPVHGGLPCPRNLQQTRICNTGRSCSPTPIHCQVKYSDWSRCEGSCGLGQQLRWGRMVRRPQYGGRPCPKNFGQQSRSCHAGRPCLRETVHCLVEYSEWSFCEGKCGPGRQERWGRVVRAAQNGGRPCSELTESRTCDTGRACLRSPVDCLVEYTDWTSCDGKCGLGRQERWARVVRQAQHGGIPCPMNLEESRTCDTGRLCLPDPIDCLVQYTDWTSCDGKCGQGRQERWARVVRKAQHGGSPCPTNLEESRTCDAGRPCLPDPIDCLVRYTDWTSCDGKCGQGRQERWARVVRKAQHGGSPCPTNLEESRTCDAGRPCLPDPIDCLVRYTDWTSCDGKCGQGRQERWARVVRKAQHGGSPCPTNLEESRTCDAGRPCLPDPIDCLVQYTDWTSCDGKCGQERQERWARVVRQAQHGGSPCPSNLEESRTCYTGRPCLPDPIDCLVQYTDWTRCDGKCGQGRQERWARVVREAQHGGSPCPRNLDESRICDTGRPCRRPSVDCQIRFGSWSGCRLACGSSTETRRASIVVRPSGGGAQCPPLIESRPCKNYTGCRFRRY